MVALLLPLPLQVESESVKQQDATRRRQTEEQCAAKGMSLARIWGGGEQEDFAAACAAVRLLEASACLHTRAVVQC